MQENTLSKSHCEDRFMDAHATLAAISGLLWGRTDNCDSISDDEAVQIGRSLARATETAQDAFFELFKVASGKQEPAAAICRQSKTNADEVNDLLRTILRSAYATEAALYGISRIDRMGFSDEDNVQERIANLLTDAGIRSNASIMTATDEFTDSHQGEGHNPNIGESS